MTLAYRAEEDEPSLSNWDPQNSTHFVYSRYTQNVSTRVEKVIGALHVSSSQIRSLLPFTNVSRKGTPSRTHPASLLRMPLLYILSLNALP